MTVARRSRVLLVTVVAGVLAVTATTASARSDATAALRAAQSRAGQAWATGGADATAQGAQVDGVAVGTQRAQFAALAAGSVVAVQDARAVEAASPHAGESLAALSSAAETVQAGSGVAGVSPVTLRGGLAALAAARSGVVQAEAAWQAAEAARIAAEQAAAEQAAAAAAVRAPSRSTGTRSSAGTTASGSSGSSGSSDPSGTSAGTVHAVSMACVTPAPGSGSAGGASAVGAAINSYRERNGLPALSVSTPGGLSSHALDMAASGGIWHSGSDNIVGCAPGSGSLVSTWAGSSAHNAQMLRTDVTSMSVGAASAAGYLFAAVAFS